MSLEQGGYGVGRKARPTLRVTPWSGERPGSRVFSSHGRLKLIRSGSLTRLVVDSAWRLVILTDKEVSTVRRTPPLRCLPPTYCPLTAVRIHLDQCVPKRLGRMLRQHGLDVTTTDGAGIAETDDREQLGYAWRERRLLITRDLGIAGWHRNGAEHAGILICPHSRDHQRVVHFVLKLVAKAEHAPLGAQQEQRSPPVPAAGPLPPDRATASAELSHSADQRGDFAGGRRSRTADFGDEFRELLHVLDRLVALRRGDLFEPHFIRRLGPLRGHAGGGDGHRPSVDVQRLDLFGNGHRLAVAVVAVGEDQHQRERIAVAFRVPFDLPHVPLAAFISHFKDAGYVRVTAISPDIDRLDFDRLCDPARRLGPCDRCRLSLHAVRVQEKWRRTVVWRIHRGKLVEINGLSRSGPNCFGEAMAAGRGDSCHVSRCATGKRPMHPPTGYIEIDRRFSRLHGSDRPEELAAASYLDGSLADSLALGWTELLKERLVVVLGEPGSGKSWEFRARCASLQEKGEYAFLIELERLAAGTFEALLAPADRERFEKWQRGGQTAWFFLDSVDEAKIRRSADFYAALDKVVAAIGGAMDRARVLISSRISEWRPASDREEVLGRFAPARPSQQTGALEGDIRVVQIVPLDRDRVRTFAERRGIGNPDHFLVALDNHSAWEFARRPLDVFELVSFWMAHGRLGSLTEIIEHDVTTKLRETVERRANFRLSESRAREGAEWLAAATLLCKQQQFKVPDETFLAQDGLDATKCLPEDWEPGEVAALLSRPLFDSATYGQIRFHHRRVSEYLAAQWICRRMAAGCPTRNLLQLLFDDASATPAPRHTLIPVLAWLCNGNERWNDEVRCWVLRGAPEIHLEYGDAEALPLEFKRALLESWIQRNRGREKVWSGYSPDAMRRLADQCLAPDIARFLVDKATPGDIREQLVQLICYGSLSACLPDLLTILGDPDEPEDLKTYVLAALRDMGTPESHRQAWDILRTAPALTNEMRSVACEALFPDTIGATDIALLLEKPDVRDEHSGGLQHAIQRLLEERLTPEHAGALIVELNRLLQIPPHIKMSNKETRISSRYEYLLEILPLALTRLLSGPVTEAECGPAAESLALIAEAQPFNRSHSDHNKALDNATTAHPCVRQCFFWQTVERWRAAHPTDMHYGLVMHEFRQVLNQSEADLEWVIQDIRNRRDRADRLLILHIAIGLVLRLGDRRLTRLRGVVNDDPEFTALLDRTRSDIRWAWLCGLRYRWTDLAGWSHWWAIGRISLRRKWNAWRVWWWLFRNGDRLRSGAAIGPLVNLCHEATNNESRFAPSSWDALARKRGKKIADAVKEGCKRSWRNYEPPLPHEKENPSQVDGRLMIGLAGIQEPPQPLQ